MFKICHENRQNSKTGTHFSVTAVIQILVNVEETLSFMIQY